MTDEPQPLNLNDVQFFAGDATESQELAPIAARQTTDADVLKATVILRALIEAGLKMPFDFNPDQAKYLWATRLKVFSLDVLTEAVTDWTEGTGNSWPSLGDVEECARFVVRERQHVKNADIRTKGECPTCGSNLSDPGYVRVEDVRPPEMEPYQIPVGKDKVPTPIDTHHMAPCPNPAHECMVKRRELYDRNHFTLEHLDKGGCPACWEYTPSLAHRARAAKRASRR